MKHIIFCQFIEQYLLLFAGTAMKSVERRRKINRIFEPKDTKIKTTYLFCVCDTMIKSQICQCSLPLGSLVSPSNPVYRQNLLSMTIMSPRSWYLSKLGDFELFLALSKMISIWKTSLHYGVRTF